MEADPRGRFRTSREKKTTALQGGVTEEATILGLAEARLREENLNPIPMLRSQALWPAKSSQNNKPVQVGRDSVSVLRPTHVEP